MLLRNLLLLLHLMSLAIFDPRPRRTVIPLALGLLCGDKPKTITSALGFLGREQQSGWSNEYRLLSQAHWDDETFFDPVLAVALRLHGDPAAPLFFAQDDTLVRKSGKNIPGTAYARDPLSPPFCVNLVLGQRFLQTSFLLRAPGATAPGRGIPLSFRPAPPLPAPPRSSAAVKAQCREQRKKHNLSTIAVADLHRSRQRVDRLGGADRLIITAVDGSFTNQTYLRQRPDRTAIVGRARKDAQLRDYLPPPQRVGNRKYGPRRFTPSQVLHDDAVPFQTFPVFVAGQQRELHYKCVRNVCWPKGTLGQPLTLIVIKAPAYRLRKNSKLLYRQPAFLLVTDPTLAPELAIEAYLARWEIEVNFREEKHTLGVGQAQVWNDRSVQRTPAFLVAGYAALLLASVQTFGDKRTAAFASLPKWRNILPQRPSLRDLIRMLRKEWQEQKEQLARPA